MPSLSLLQQEHGTAEHAGHHGEHAVSLTELECLESHSGAAGSGAASGSRRTRKASVDSAGSTSRGTSRHAGGAATRAGGGAGRDGRGVDADRVLGAARVVGAAGGGTGVVAAAVADTLGAPFLAEEEGEGLRVHGDVGRDAVGADAVVGQGVGVTVVGVGCGRVAGGLEADEWAFGDLRCAPLFCFWC